MAEVALTPDQYRKLIALITRRANVLTTVERQNLLDLAGLSQFIGRVNLDTNAQVFSQQLVRVLQDYGTLVETKQPALVSLLATIRDQVAGHEEETAFIDALLIPYTRGSSKVSMASSGSSAPGQTPGSKIRILFLSANPRGTPQLRLDEEVRTIEERLREGKYRDRFELKSQWALRWTDLPLYLMEFQPHIVHFSGHGAETSELVLESADSQMQIIPAQSISDLFRILKGNVRLVVLNACWSAHQAEAIAAHIDCVVGMIQPVNDSAAVHFAAGFYRSLGFGYNVQTAFDLGKNEVSATFPDGKDIPQLICRSGMDASTVKF